MESVAARLGFFVGGILSFFIGLLLSPAWEMAHLTIVPTCMVMGAFAGLLSSQSWKGTSAATLLALLTTAGMGWLARKNPDWVVHQAMLAVAAGVGVSVLVGFVARKLPSTRGVPGK